MDLGWRLKLGARSKSDAMRSRAPPFPPFLCNVYVTAQYSRRS